MWLLVYLQSCAPSPQPNFKIFSSSQKETSYPFVVICISITPSPRQPPICFVFMSSYILAISCKWNHMVCDSFLILDSAKKQTQESNRWKLKHQPYYSIGAWLCGICPSFCLLHTPNKSRSGGGWWKERLPSSAGTSCFIVPRFQPQEQKEKGGRQAVWLTTFKWPPTQCNWNSNNP